MINVTKVFLPPIDEYQAYIKDIYKRAWVTNNGPLVNELELKLKDKFCLPHLLYLSNGTLALQIAIKAFDLKGEIITTPFSYVATTSSIVWEGCKPVFVDIDPATLNIAADKIEAAITTNTSAILATHVYGNPCDIYAIQAIAKKYNLKVIYDGAHAFDTKYDGLSVFGFGDISTCSFHATKLFHTIEGGAVFTMQPDVLRKLALLRNFGHTAPESFEGAGINAKSSEFHAAMGLVNLKYAESLLVKRKTQWQYYFAGLKNLNVQFLQLTKGTTTYNHAYFPIIFQDESSLIEAQTALQQQYVYPRRYFYPALNKLNYVEHQTCPVAESVSARVLCLPLYHDLTAEEQDMIIRILLRTQNN